MNSGASKEEIESFGHDTKVALHALDQFLNADTLDALWDRLIEFADSMKMDLLSYHHQLTSSAPGQDNVTVRARGFPEDWVESYVRKKQHLTDPITQVFSARVRPMHWSKVDQIVSLTPAQTAYLADLRSWLKGDGLGLPVFGPGGRIGYVGIGRTDRGLEDWGALQINRVHWIAQSFHVRWCEIAIFNLPKDFTLSDRELQVLKSLAHGVSDEVICAVVGAPIDSVRQTIRNVMKKMGVTDRPSAILRGVGSGILDPDSVVLS
ncbi:MAG: LuxR family transcriptional regulator [Litorimonas sp.]